MKKEPLRIKLQKGIYSVINPFVKLLIKWGLTPNAVTTIGLILNIGVAVIFIIGAEEGNRSDFTYVGWAGTLILFAGLFDMLDGQVARLGNMSSTFGAMYDSVLDRYSELILFLGICYYLVAQHFFFSSLFAFIAMIGSMMVSYTRARAEGLGIECKGGLMQRPERVILIGLSGVACGIFSYYKGGDYKLFIKGIPFHIVETMSIFTLPLVVLAVLSNITAINRLRDSKKALEAKERKAARKEVSEKVLLSALLVIGMLGFTGLLKAQSKQVAYTFNIKSPQDTFPVPPTNPNHLFYLQRTPNNNTIICDLNYQGNGIINDDDPVHVYWIRYTEQGQTQELSFVQRHFAYGIKSRPLGGGKYELHFVSIKKHKLYLMRSPVDNKYHVYATIAQKQAQLNRVFVLINGGTLWSPHVEYIELKGTDPATGKELVERLKV